MALSIAHHIPMFYKRWGRLLGVAVWSAKKKPERIFMASTTGTIFNLTIKSPTRSDASLITSPFFPLHLLSKAAQEPPLNLAGNHPIAESALFSTIPCGPFLFFHSLASVLSFRQVHNQEETTHRGSSGRARPALPASPRCRAVYSGRKERLQYPDANDCAMASQAEN